MAIVPMWKRICRPPKSLRKKVAPETREVPAIPGYVMIFMEGAPREIRRVLATQFLNGKPCVHSRVPGMATQDEMKKFLDFLGRFEERSNVKQSVKAGDIVRVHYGPLEGKTGVVESVKGAKANVLIELFKVTVKTEAIELSEQPEKKDARGSNSLHKTANHGTRSGRDEGRQVARG